MRWVKIGLLLCTFLGTAHADSWEIVAPEAVLGACRAAAGDLVYSAGEGETWRLITRLSDAEIRNRGAGAFYPVPEDQVADALTELDPRLRDQLSACIVLLPYPRRGLLRSSCNGETIYLSPSVRPLTRAQVHCLLYHEIGHVLHAQLLPDTDRMGWLAFEELLWEAGVRPAIALHPHECFAECFRLLYGTPEARSVRPIGSGWVHTLRDREPLREFFEVLIAAERARLYCASER